jgi:hypothetical protein
LLEAKEFVSKGFGYSSNCYPCIIVLRERGNMEREEKARGTLAEGFEDGSQASMSSAQKPVLEGSRAQKRSSEDAGLDGGEDADF